MSYRDELEAARQRNEELKRELADARDRITELESGAHAPLAPHKAPAPLARAPLRFGTMHFHRPPTYFPLFHLFRASVRAAFAFAPSLGGFRSDSVIAGVAYYILAVPLTYGLRIPLYYLSLCIVLPVALLVCVVFSLPLLPIVLASRLTFSSDAPRSDVGWLSGTVTAQQGAMFLWVLESICLWPLLLTTTSLLDGAGD